MVTIEFGLQYGDGYVQVFPSERTRDESFWKYPSESLRVVRTVRTERITSDWTATHPNE